ncbi:MAG: hypothetical protein N3D20_00600 [Candidatus Pacearchaeota archaeon]|nr:hypothetical protein [Candidatus Pacearchaeota archaeon]
MGLEQKISKKGRCLRETKHANSQLIGNLGDYEQIYRCNNCGAIYSVPIKKEREFNLGYKN